MHNTQMHSTKICENGVVQEDALLLLAHEKHGNKWIEIAKMVGGRSVSPNPLILASLMTLSVYVTNASWILILLSILRWHPHSILTQAEQAEPVLNLAIECTVCILKCYARRC